MNGFFGKLKDKVFGVAKAKEVQAAKVTKPKAYHTRDLNHKQKGAFGGTGNNRRLRGKPGVKLIKKTVKAGISATKRVLFAPAGGVK